MGKSCMARGSDLRVSYKNTHATARILMNMSLVRAQAFLKNVLAHKECVPFFRHTGGIGRCAQAKQWKTSQGRWPAKSARFILDMLKNAESNATFKGLDTERLKIKHVAVHRACQMRRRTYRAHGRINPYMSTPCHVEFILEEKPEHVPIPGLGRLKRAAYRNSCFKVTKAKKRSHFEKKKAALAASVKKTVVTK